MLIFVKLSMWDLKLGGGVVMIWLVSGVVHLHREG